MDSVNRSSVQKYRDGLTIEVFGLPPIATAIAKTMPLWMLKRVASREAKDGYSQLMLSAPLIGILAVRDRYDQENCLRAGRIWQRAHWLATARGLAGRPCNEAIEMIDQERTRGKPASRCWPTRGSPGHERVATRVPFYMGYATLAARASPRRPLARVLLLSDGLCTFKIFSMNELWEVATLRPLLGFISCRAFPGLDGREIATSKRGKLCVI